MNNVIDFFEHQHARRERSADQKDRSRMSWRELQEMAEDAAEQVTPDIRKQHEIMRQEPILLALKYVIERNKRHRFERVISCYERQLLPPMVSKKDVKIIPLTPRPGGVDYLV